MKTSWEVLNFDDVFEDVTKYFTKIPANDYKSDGYHAIIDQSQQFIAGYTDIDLPKNEIESPLIIFGDHTRIFKFIDFECFIGADGVKVLRNKIIGDTKYYYHFLTNLEIENNGYSRHFKFLKRHKIIVPPIPEQKRIAAILDKADEIRRKREQAIAKLEQLAQSIFVEMFGDPVKNEKNFSSEQLRNLVKKIQIGPFGSQLHEEDYIEGGIPLINPTHIKSGKIQPDYKLSIPQIKYDTLQQYHLEKGDLIIGRRGEMGRCAVVTDKENGMLCGTGSLFVRLLQDLITPEYLCQTISSQSMREHLQNVSQGVTMANLNKDIVGSLKIIVPPIALQEEFAKRIKQIEKLKADNTKALANHNALFASLQQQAFSGNL